MRCGGYGHNQVSHSMQKKHFFGLMIDNGYKNIHYKQSSGSSQIYLYNYFVRLYQ